jgi:ABC-type antimicrobial peptide transport system permease subunit
MTQTNKTPRWARALLRKFAHPDTLEEVEGDLQEFFTLWQKEYGTRKARLKYILTVLTLLRPFTTSKRNRYSPLSILPIMMTSYLKMSWRTLLRNRLSSVINISGLTLGLTTSILIALVVENQLKTDQFHANLPSIHLLMKNVTTNDGISTDSSTPGLLAETLRTDFPEVKYTARMLPFNESQVMVNNKISYESGIYADPDLFRIMTFPSLAGDAANVLESGAAVVITKDMARKLFADEDPIGETIVFDKHHSLTVGAVVDNIPLESTVRFGIVIPFVLFEKENKWLKKWDDNRIMTWTQLQPSVDVSLFNSKTTQLVQQKSNDKFVSLFAYPLKDLYLRGSFSNGLPNGGRITGVQMLIAFGVFMLLIACINFMNIATAQSEQRAKEVGVRKTLGASRKWIIFQFLNESFMITFLSLFVAIGLAVMITPSFNTLTHSHIQFDFTSLSIWLLVTGITMVTALLAGSYPSFFLSRFMPALVLKGRISIKGGGLRKSLVTFQFAISIFFLIGTIIMYAQVGHVRNRPLGYEQENLVDIQLDSLLSAKFAYLKTEVAKISGVTSITGVSNNILYSGGAVTGMDWPGKQPGEDLSVAIAHVGYDWTKTMQIQIIQGRDFSPAFASDVSACIINQAAVDKMGLQNPIGAMVGGHPVIGVFQNFVYNNPFGSISPMAVYLNSGNVNHLYVRVQNNSGWRETLSRIEKLTKNISPEFPFQFSFTKEEYQHRFSEASDTSIMISIFAGMTIFISCLGLFGLSGFVAERRSKEMSIRKVFGATMLRILVSLSHDFLKPVFYALVLIIPLSIFIAQQVLSNFTYRVALSWWMFVSAGIMILLIAVLIVLYHGWRTARENPVLRLRDE